METLREAWGRATCGPDGRFARGHRDFATALTDPVTAPVLCAHLLDLAVEADLRLGRADFTVVDVGAGTGTFLAHVAAHGPAHWRLRAVEIAPRPTGLDARIAWGTALPEFAGFLLAHEWLDDVPLDVVSGGRTVLADGTLGGDHDMTWLDAWGGDEDGSTRDDAWRRATDRLTAGTAHAVDYGHTRACRRPTLTGWRDGRAVPAVLDGSCDVTAHVALDSLDGTLTPQRDALAGLDPGDTRGAAGLRRASAVRALRDPDGYGGYGWVSLVRGDVL